MSVINCFRHEIIGVCKNGVPLYRLLQDIPNDLGDFDGKKGDILLGGGGGESPALRVSIKDAIQLSTNLECDLNKEFFGGIVKAFWSMTTAYCFGKEYAKMGWDYREMPIETWLTEQIVSFVINNYEIQYRDFIGNDRAIINTEEELKCIDGSIFRMPNEEEKAEIRYIADLKPKEEIHCQL